MALWKGSPLARFGSVALLVAFDQWSKAAIFDWLGATPEGQSPRYPLFGTRWLSFWTSSNKGAAFGQFGDFPLTLVVGRAAAVLFLVWLLVRSDSRPRLPLYAMTLVLAGALGNLIDNLWTGCVHEGHPIRAVRDFLDVDFEPLFGIAKHFPAFNVADSCITVGACAWILAGFLHRAPAAGAPAEPSEGATPAR